MQFLRHGHRLVLKSYQYKVPKYFYLNELVEVNGIDDRFEPVTITIPADQYKDTEHLSKYTIAEVGLSCFGLKTIIL